MLRAVMQSITAALAAALLLGGCGASSGDAEAAVERSAPSADQLAFARTDLRVAPGATVLNRVDVGGTTVEFGLFVPTGHVLGEPAPLLVAFPPGAQTVELVERTMLDVYGPEAERRGWVVVSPVAPTGVRYFDGSEDLVPAFMDAIEAISPPTGGRAHVAGMSNGGISAFRVAANEPNRWASVTVFPGFAQTESDRDRLRELNGIPVTLFVGESDESWVEAADKTVASLAGVEVDVTYEIIAGEDHIIESLWNGSRLWDAFAEARLSAGG